MSSEAIDWAFKQIIGPASLKFTLIALSHCANFRTGRVMPSIAHVTSLTGLNRKTIITNIAELERLKLIRDTGERCGRTQQIKVYQVSREQVPEAEQFQIQNSSEFAIEESRKWDTEPSLEPSNTPQTSNEVCSTPIDGNASDTLKPEDFAEAWNVLAVKIGRPPVRRLTPERRAALRSRVAAYSLSDFQEVIANIEQSPFLRGDKDWPGCTFDWVTKKSNFQKILEGNYSA